MITAIGCTSCVYTKVLLEGHGLSGPDYLEVQPNGEALYPLTFSPRLAGQTKGRLDWRCVCYKYVYLIVV